MLLDTRSSAFDFKAESMGEDGLHSLELDTDCFSSDVDDTPTQRTARHSYPADVGALDVNEWSANGATDSRSIRCMSGFELGNPCGSDGTAFIVERVG